MARTTRLVILIKNIRRTWLDRLGYCYILSDESSIPFYSTSSVYKCYILSDESSISFYSTSNGYKYSVKNSRGKRIDFFCQGEQSILYKVAIIYVLRTHQFDVLADQKGAGLGWCVWALIVIVHVICLLFIVYWMHPKTSGKQIVVYRSELTVLRCPSGKVATWPV